MKLKFVLLILILSLNPGIYSQTNLICGVFPQQNNFICYSDVVEARNLAAEQLYENAKNWISENLGNNGIQTDVINSTLLLTGSIEVAGSRENFLSFSLNLTFNDGRFDYELTGLRYQIPESGIDMQLESLPEIENCNTETVDNLNYTIRGLIQSYTSEIKSGMNYR